MEETLNEATSPQTRVVGRAWRQHPMLHSCTSYRKDRGFWIMNMRKRMKTLQASGRVKSTKTRMRETRSLQLNISYDGPYFRLAALHCAQLRPVRHWSGTFPLYLSSSGKGKEACRLKWLQEIGLGYYVAVEMHMCLGRPAHQNRISIHEGEK